MNLVTRKISCGNGLSNSIMLNANSPVYKNNHVISKQDDASTPKIL